MGREVVKVVSAQPDMELVGAVDKEGVGKDVFRTAGVEKTGVMISPDLSARLSKTNPQEMGDFPPRLSVRKNIRRPVRAGVPGEMVPTGWPKKNWKEMA